MTDLQSYESRIADLDLNLKPFPSRHQSTHEHPANRDHGESCTTDNGSVSPGHTEKTQRSAMNVLKGLKVDQAGMIWGSNGTLLGKVLDDGLAVPEELEDYPANEQGEILDEDGQKMGQPLAHETSPSKSFKSAREHPFYNVRPDKNGQYHCPYTASEDCWYRPQKLKFKFE